MKKKIIIELEAEGTNNERIFEFAKSFCIDNFQNFKVSLEGTELNYEFKRK